MIIIKIDIKNEIYLVFINQKASVQVKEKLKFALSC